MQVPRSASSTAAITVAPSVTVVEKEEEELLELVGEWLEFILQNETEENVCVL
jgi:hypothetical protein